MKIRTKKWWEHALVSFCHVRQLGKIQVGERSTKITYTLWHNSISQNPVDYEIKVKALKKKKEK